jgi:mono/diheme cytochrome c family protein
MRIRRAALLSSLLFVALFGASAKAQFIPNVPNQWQLPPEYVPSGEVMFGQYCAACHGADAKGNGPVAATLKTPPPDLSTLAKRHEGKFPASYVSTVLLFGPGTTSHGSATMPTWGPIFGVLDKQNSAAVQQRIKNLTDYLASIQEK